MLYHCTRFCCFRLNTPLLQLKYSQRLTTHAICRELFCWLMCGSVLTLISDVSITPNLKLTGCKVERVKDIKMFTAIQTVMGKYLRIGALSDFKRYPFYFIESLLPVHVRKSLFEKYGTRVCCQLYQQ